MTLLLQVGEKAGNMFSPQSLHIWDDQGGSSVGIVVTALTHTTSHIHNYAVKSL